MLVGTFTIHAQQKGANYEYSYIDAVKEQNGVQIINADYVQYLTGKAALNAAIAKGDVERNFDKNGKPEWYIPNDFYIVNDNKKTRKLILDKSCTYHLLTSENNLPTLANQSFSDFKTNFSEKLFKVFFNKNGSVSKIEEVYMP